MHMVGAREFRAAARSCDCVGASPGGAVKGCDRINQRLADTTTLGGPAARMAGRAGAGRSVAPVVPAGGGARELFQPLQRRR